MQLMNQKENQEQNLYLQLAARFLLLRISSCPVHLLPVKQRK